MVSHFKKQYGSSSLKKIDLKGPCAILTLIYSNDFNLQISIYKMNRLLIFLVRDHHKKHLQLCFEICFDISIYILTSPKL